jgi:DNA polymerase-3 subunit alpha
LKSIEGIDFTVAGIVTNVQNLMTKTTSKPYGQFTIEDYSDSYEFVLYSRDYEQFRQYMYEDYFLSIKGKVQPHPYREGELEIKITSIMPLDKVEENIHELYITLSIEDLTNITINVLEDLFEKYKTDNPKEAVPVKFRIIDAAKDVFLPMVAKNTKIKISNEMCSVLDNYGINYSFK